MLLRRFPLEKSIALETGEQIPIVFDLSEASCLMLHSGCFLLRNADVAVSYGGPTEAMKLAQQLDTALVSVLFRSSMASLPTSRFAEQQNTPPRSQHIHHHHQHSQQSHQTSMSRVQSQSVQHSRTPSVKEVAFRKQDDFKPDAQQLQWLDSLPRTEKSKEAELEELADEEKEEAEKLRANEPAAVVLEDTETGETILEEGRTTFYTSSMLSGLALAINMVIMSLFARDIVLNTLADFNYMRLVLLVATLPRFFVSQFFCEHVILIIAQVCFPISQVGTFLAVGERG